MKTFEELYTEAVDGILNESDRVTLEAEMVKRGISPDDILRDRALRKILSENVPQPTFTNQDFFRHSLLDRIRREANNTSADAARASRKFTWLRWSRCLPAWQRLAWGAAFSLAAAIALTITLKPYESHDNQPLTTRILSLHEFADGISATAMTSSSSHYAVVWTDGIEYLPAGSRIQ